MSDWRDGFLFVGNHVSLDFLNTAPVVDGATVELLPSPESFARWLGAAQLISPNVAKQLNKAWSNGSAVGLERILQFREKLRNQIQLLEAGERPSVGFIRDVNQLLATYPETYRMVWSDSALYRHPLFHPDSPQDAFAPLVSGVADLLTNVDLSRLRKCESCVLHFLDNSKKGSRRWCSMRLCGNRAKVHAYYTRTRRGK